MNFKKIKLFAIITFLIMVQGLSAQAKGPDAVYKNVVIEYQLNEDGSTSYHYSHQLKLLTNNAFRRQYGETFIIYDPLYQKLTVNKSETTMADGKKVASTDNAYNEVLPRFARNAPAYNRLREMVVTHLGVEINATINIDYKIETQKDFLPGLMGEEILANSSPITNAAIRLIVPASKTIYFELFNSKVEPVIKGKGNNKIYEWNFENIPAVYPERNHPAAGNFAPRLVFSTFTDLNKAMAATLSQPAFNPPPIKENKKNKENKELELLVHQLKNESTSDLDFILKIQNKVADEISTYHIPPLTVGFRVRTPLEIWQSNGGTVFEKSVLLSSLLEMAGFPAEPILFAQHEPYSKKVASLPVFNKAMAHTKLDGQCMVLPVDKPLSMHFRYEFPVKTIALLISPLEDAVKVLQIPAIKAAENKTILNAVLNIENEEMISGEATLTLTGAANPYYTFHGDVNSLKSLITGSINAMDTEEFKVQTLGQEKSAGNAKIKCDNPFTKQDDYLFWKIPENPKGFDSWHIAALSVNRLHPFEIPFPVTEENSFTLQLPENMKLITPVQKIEKSNSVGSILIEVVQQHGTVLIKRNLTLNEKVITPEKFSELLELWRLWESEAYKELCFKII